MNDKNVDIKATTNPYKINEISCSKSKVLSLSKACFDLISSPSPSMKIQIMGRKVTQNLGFESPL